MIFNLKSQNPFPKNTQKPKDLYSAQFNYKDLVSRLNSLKAQQLSEKKKIFQSFDNRFHQDSTREPKKPSKKIPNQAEKSSNKTILIEKVSNEIFIRKKRTRNLTSSLFELRPGIRLNSLKRNLKLTEPT
jgi:hypothetical protein